MMPTLVSAVARTMHGLHEEAAACSHRPDDVRALFIDANASYRLASGVLDMPEMHAIRKQLHQWLTHLVWAAPPDMTATEVREATGLPPSVIDWILSYEETA